MQKLGRRSTEPVKNFLKTPFKDTKSNSTENIIEDDYSGVIAFVNPKSGSQTGAVLIRKLTKYLKEDQIFDLSMGGPKEGLLQHKDTKDLRVVICGGDGTVGWVLSAIDDIEFEKQPGVAIIPLGTGNDLARTLGWGSGYTSESVQKYLNNINKGTVVLLDRLL
jgi:diacylglycerol kinase (ATP)